MVNHSLTSRRQRRASIEQTATNSFRTSSRLYRRISHAELFDTHPTRAKHFIGMIHTQAEDSERSQEYAQNASIPTPQRKRCTLYKQLTHTHTTRHVLFESHYFYPCKKLWCCLSILEAHFRYFFFMNDGASYYTQIRRDANLVSEKMTFSCSWAMGLLIGKEI